MSRPLRILTWHVHGSYLYYLSRVPHEFFLPVREGRPEGYGGRTPSFRWPSNVNEVPADRVAAMEFDCVLYQSHRNYLIDRHEILSPAQQRLPGIYLEHDPPRQHPVDTRHPVNDPDLLLVHVTHFNDLMWDSGRTPTRVIEHGVTVPEDVRYTGELPSGIVVVNGLATRGRRLGLDVFERARREVPLDLVGMGSEEMGGLGEVGHDRLPAFMACYRFFFNPIRYTSLGLAVCEAMMCGLPIVALATTEMATVVQHELTGYVDTNQQHLIEAMHSLVRNPNDAAWMGDQARRYAQVRFDIRRFVQDWEDAFRMVTAGGRSGSLAVGAPVA